MLIAKEAVYITTIQELAVMFMQLHSKNSFMTYEFEIPGHVTRQEWAVYVVIISDKTTKRLFYIGKTGDNREGCNPIISRIGNHLSHNKIHSQLRNKLKDPTKVNYRIAYSTFGKYDKKKHQLGRDKINQLERELNQLIQSKTSNNNDCEVLNLYKGIGITKAIKSAREKLLNSTDRNMLEDLAQKAVLLK
jgi:hypothetical protein